MNTGKLIVVSAPSGAGKSTLLKKVMAKLSRLAFSVSHTTRPPRNGEQDGVDYHFVDRAMFESMIEKDLFIEFAEVHGNLYGTSRKAVFDLLEQNYDVILEIDVQGAEIIRSSGKHQAVYIFVSPPTMQELENRLRARGTENEERIRLRLRNAETEFAAARMYEYLIINDELDDAVNVLCSIILAERARGHRRSSGEPIGVIQQK